VRPHRVTLQAYGAFAGIHLIDFDLLGSNQLFQISGPTGSGKTTILDGLCFALFDEASGKDRSSSDMRSHHAAPELESRVSLDFSVGPRRYRIVRTPRQMRPKRSGTGLTEQAPTATLWDRTDTTDWDQEGVVLETQVRTVTKKVEEIVGLSADQLRQTFMLPQGEFRKVITADSKQRAEILRKLFETSRYAHIELLLKEKRNLLKRELDHFVTARTALLGQVEVDNAEALVDLISQLAQKFSESQKQTQTVEAALHKHQSAVEGGRAANAKLLELAQTTEQLEGLLTQADTFDAKAEQLVRAQAGKQLRDVHDLRNARKTELERSEEAVATAQTQLLSAQAGAQKASEALEQEKARHAERVGAQQECDRLGGLADKVALLAAAQKEAGQCEELFLSTKNAVELAVQGVAERRTQQRAAEEAIQENKILAAGAQAATVAAQSLARNLEARRLLGETQALHAQAQEQIRLTKESLSSANQAATVALEHYNGLERERMEGQAALLAEQLQDGQACPVCGSDSHPAPAQMSSSMPSQEEVESAKGALQAAEKTVQEKQQAATAAEVSQAKHKGSIESLCETLGELAELSEAALESRVQKAQQEFQASQEAAANLEKQTAELGAGAAAVGAAESAQAQAQSAHQEAQKALAGVIAVRDERAKEVPDELVESGALEAALAAANNKVAHLKKALEVAQENSSHCAEKLQLCQGKSQTLAGTLNTAKERLKDAENDLKRRIAEAKFTDFDDYEQACMDDSVTKALDEAIQSYRELLAQAKDRHKRAQKTAKEVQSADLETLEAAAASALQAHGEHKEAHGELTKELADKKQLKEDLERIALEQGRKNQQFELVGRLADVANGKNGAGLTFERFVLAAMLDDVLVATNRRFRQMTSERYSMHRTEVVGDGRKRGGLDLEVMDEYTGKARSVKTLSGGEGFEASLALALGLADIVQAQAGGIHLDTIFVDEGFGSLGDEDLDAVMNALEDLQKGGRMVGIISHVAELAERIPARLEVTKGKTGSQAEFILP
jgi:exonuclease SbcC